MFKKIWHFGKKTVKKHFAIKTWSNSEGVKETFHWLNSLITRILAVPKAKRQEKFEQAITRLHMGEKALLQRYRFFRQMVRIYMACMVALLIYGHVYLYKQTDNIWMLMAVYLIALLLLAQAFRYSYWSCQIAKRHLGCSITDWFLWLIKVRS